MNQSNDVNCAEQQPEKFSFATIISVFKEWPSQFAALMKNPRSKLAELPAKGSWVKPLIYFAAGYLAYVLFMAFLGVPIWFILIGALVIGIPAYVVATLIFNWILGKLNTNPGFYRTTYFFSLLVPIGIAAFMLAFIHPILSLAVYAVYFYLLYYYFLECGKLSNKQAGVFIGILAVMCIWTALPMLGGQQAMERKLLKSAITLTPGNTQDKEILKNIIENAPEFDDEESIEEFKARLKREDEEFDKKEQEYARKMAKRWQENAEKMRNAVAQDMTQ